MYMTYFTCCLQIRDQVHVGDNFNTPIVLPSKRAEEVPLSWYLSCCFGDSRPERGSSPSFAESSAGALGGASHQLTQSEGRGRARG
jgi:hypothetical protein